MIALFWFPWCLLWIFFFSLQYISLLLQALVLHDCLASDQLLCRQCKFPPHWLVSHAWNWEDNSVCLLNFSSVEVTTKCVRWQQWRLPFVVWLCFNYEQNFNHTLFLYKLTKKLTNDNELLSFWMGNGGTRGWWLWLLLTKAETWGSGNTEGRWESNRISNVIFMHVLK